jgi:hypothetical protein
VSVADYYVLTEDFIPVAVADGMTMARWLASERDLPNGGKWRAGLTEWADETYVSTVFMGINHSFGCGPPLLWETMAFPAEEFDLQERYTSMPEAIAGHKVAVQLMMMSREQRGLNPTPARESLAVIPAGSPLR